MSLLECIIVCVCVGVSSALNIIMANETNTHTTKHLSFFRLRVREMACEIIHCWYVSASVYGSIHEGRRTRIRYYCIFTCFALLYYACILNVSKMSSLALPVFRLVRLALKSLCLLWLKTNTNARFFFNND